VKGFEPILRGTQCLFARAARLWGSTDWDQVRTLEQNVADSLPSLELFIEAYQSMHLDGFVFEMRGRELCPNVETFGQTIQRVLWTLSEADPAGVHCMRKSYIDKRGWCFEFANETFFVTTFAPCYGVDSSRYTFDADSESCFLLLQPEFSFAQRDIGDDTPETNWDDPKTIRDRIRVEYKKHGREYEIPDSIVYPPASHIVRPLHIGEPVVTWWRT